MTFFLHNNQYQIAAGIIIIFLVALGLQGCAQAFSSCGDQGYSSSCGVWISHCGSLSCCRAWALGVAEITTQETKHHTQRAGELTFTMPEGPEQLTLQALSPEQRGYRVFIDSL